MNAESLKRTFGEEYPSAVVIKGVRMPLSRETRFSRRYSAVDSKMRTHVSRFMDGSASMTIAQLRKEWPAWAADERSDFCGSCNWLSEQADFPDMLRFIVQHAETREWMGIALSVASRLPLEEAFETLRGALCRIDIGLSANFVQAISKTKHPDAEATLRQHLETMWGHPTLWNDDRFLNHVAFSATTCIAYLIELGAAPADFEDKARQLFKHVCADNRDACRRRLSNWYSRQAECDGDSCERVDG